MATSKNLLNTTLESFLTYKKEFIGNQALPTKSAIILTAETGSSSAERKFTPSYDGYVRIEAFRSSSSSDNTMSCYFPQVGGLRGGECWVHSG